MQLSEWVISHNQSDRLTLKAKSPNSLSISVAAARKPVETDWEIQMLHRLPPLLAGQRYALTFRASGTLSRAFHIKLTLPRPPWTWIENGQLVEVGRNERLYELYYAPSEDLPEIQLQMDLAAAEGTIEISDLRLVALGPRAMVPERSYIICATPRSGSSWLASLLWNTGAAGYPSESFLHHHSIVTGNVGHDVGTQDWNLPRAAYISRVIDKGMTANGVFGTKVMLGYLDTTADWLGAPFDLNSDRFDQVFEHYFPGVRYLHLFRRDKVDQAVSMYIASQTDAWRAGAGDNESALPPYDAVSIKREYDHLIHEDSEWVRRLSGLRGFVGSIAYEDLRDDYSRTIENVFSRLDLHPTAFPKPHMTSVRRQVSPLKSQYGDRFRAEENLPYPIRSR